MGKLHTDPKLELHVKDFGPIAEARIDLRPLTVFIGPSNTGKSYPAILIYALHRNFGDGTGLLGRHPAGPGIEDVKGGSRFSDSGLS